MQTLDRDEITTVVAAPPDEVYALVADVVRTPEFSPDVVRCRWLDGATEPAVGARFEAVNRNLRGQTWRNRPVVVAAEAGREFAFARTEPFMGTLVWRYRFQPVDDGTRVTESYEVVRPITRFGWFVLEKVFRAGDRRAALRAGMQTTLERLRTRAEGAPTRSADRAPGAP
jgi:ribosome-associated toxin RatA of RatAB toxin-antitoxin module